jgi:Tfp pilus assembly protein PilP
MTYRTLAMCSMLAVALAGCGGGAPAGSPSASTAHAAPAPPAAATKPAPIPSVLPRVPDPGPALAAIDYEPKGRRDPFATLSVASPKAGGLNVNGLKLAGVIGGETLLALVEAPDGLGYILKPGDVLGDGRVSSVTANSVTFAVTGRPGQAPTALTLRLED